jgi:hypothetical protein
MTLVQAINDRSITEIMHFTTNRGFVGALAAEFVLSRARLPENKYIEKIVHENSAYRPEAAEHFDKSQDWLDYVNLSISDINSRFFIYSTEWHKHADVWWVIMAFSPEIISHEGVFFATTNNAYEHCRRQQGIEGFNQLFVPRVLRKGNWSATRMGRPDSHATCEQAEVLYPQRLSMDFLQTVYVRTDEDADRVAGWLREFSRLRVVVKVDPAKFNGSRN